MQGKGRSPASPGWPPKKRRTYRCPSPSPSPAVLRMHPLSGPAPQSTSKGGKARLFQNCKIKTCTDVWKEMGAYLGPSARPLRATNRFVRSLKLHQSHQEVLVDCRDLPNWATWCQHHVCTATITLVPCEIRDQEATPIHKVPFQAAIATLQRAPKLHKLQITVQPGSQFGNTGAHAVGTLCTSSSLTHLILRAEEQNIGGAGAAGLAHLATSPRLRTLSLILDGNHLRDMGAQSLPQLNHSLAIDDLILNLTDNKIGN